MNNALRIVLGAILLPLLFGTTAAALQRAEIRFDPEAPLSPTEREAGELEAYAAIIDEPSPDRLLLLAARFLSDYATSEFRHLVLRARWEARIEQGDLEGVISGAREGLEALEHFASSKLAFIGDPSRVRGYADFRFATATQEAEYYKSIVEAARDLGDFETMVEYGEPGLRAAAEAWGLYPGFEQEGTPAYEAAVRQNQEIRGFILFNILAGYERRNDVGKIIEYNERILELTPDDLETLMAVSRLMAEQPPADPAEITAHMLRARRYAESAVEELETLFSGAYGALFDDPRRAALRGEVQSTLGLVHLRLEEWEAAARAYGAAIRAIPDEPVFYFMLGIASRQLGDADAFLSAYARAVYLGIAQPQARADLETFYATRHGSLEGLEEFIAAEGAGIEVRETVETRYTREAYIEDVIGRIDLLPTVFAPNRMCYQYYEFLATQDLSWAEDALEIGVGSGVNSLILLDQGVGRVVGTDINDNAVRNFEMNAGKFGHSERIDARLVPLDEPEAFSVIDDDEKFDLIISNPPWEDEEPRRIQEYAYLDNNWVLLHSMLDGMADHLKEGGKVWLLYGDPRVVPSEIPPAVEIILREAPENRLTPTVLHRSERCSIVEIEVAED